MACCKMMEQIMEQFPLPFCYPIVINQTNLDLEVKGLAIKLYKKTQAGNLSKRGSATAFLNYCPWCGKQLREIETREREPNTPELSKGKIE